MGWVGCGNAMVGVVGLGTAHWWVIVRWLCRFGNVGVIWLFCWTGLGTALCFAWWAGLELVGLGTAQLFPEIGTALCMAWLAWLVGLGTAQLFPGSVGRGGGTYQVGGGTSWLLIGCSGWLLANVGARS